MRRFKLPRFTLRRFHRYPLLAMAMLLFAHGAMAERIIHKEKSLYRNIVVSQKANRRCLVFSIKRQQRNQTCIDTKNKNRIIFSYVQMTFAGLLANPEPRRALMIGMGGGTISNVLTAIYPELHIDLIEVDQAVVNVAKEYFGFVETEKTQVHVSDGRVFTKRALLKGNQYDLVILDAFTGEYIPEHMMTKEFLQDVDSLLTPDGVVVANTFTGSSLYDHESVTYTQVFGPFLNLKMPGSGNRVIVATKSGLPDNKTLSSNAMMLASRFEPYNIDLQRFVPKLRRDPDWDTGKRPLTDQYAPANLLKRR